MAEERSSTRTDGRYWMGLVVGLMVGAALFWLTIKILIAVR